MNLTLDPGLFEKIVAEARLKYPIEACGLLAGRAMSASRYIAMTNALHSETAYAMDPAELISVLKSLRAGGEDLVAFVHSHPRGPATMSARDLSEANYPEAAHVIVSLAEPKSPQVQAFRVINGEAVPIELRVIV